MPNIIGELEDFSLSFQEKDFSFCSLNKKWWEGLDQELWSGLTGPFNVDGDKSHKTEG